MEIVERARRYVAKLPASISGHGGHNHLYRAAVVVVKGFGIDDEDEALEILLEFNRRCVPRWSENELVHKIQEAQKADADDGFLLEAQGRDSPWQETEEPSAEEIAAQHERAEAKRQHQKLVAYAEAVKSAVITTPPLWLERSPVALDPNPPKHFEQWLQLYRPSDVVWCGAIDETGRPCFEVPNFRPVEEWQEMAVRLASKPIQAIYGPFTCPSVFKPGSYSRCNENVLSRPFLVIESDTLSQEQQASLIEWLRQILKLRAVVWSTRRSLHAWFDFPKDDQFAELRIVLPVLGCDPKLFTASQPCRLPGAERPETEKVQSLLYLDVNDLRHE